MGRGKIEIKRIENTTNRQVTFSKRRGGLMKKANELAVLCDAQVGLIVFSSSGKMYEYCSEPLSMMQIMERYQRHTKTRIEVVNNQQLIMHEVERMRSESDKLQASMRHYTGEDLACLTMNDLNQLQEQLEMSVTKVRVRKDQLLRQQVDNLRRKEQILEDQNSYLAHVLAEHQAAMQQQQQQQQLEMEHKVGEPVGFYNPGFYVPEEARNLLPLSPQLNDFRLQPSQPNLQEASFIGHGLQLW